MKKKTIVIIVVAVVGAILINLAPFLIILLGITQTGSVDFKESGNTVKVDKYGINLTVDNSRYDAASKCYILETRVEKSKKSKLNSSMEFNFEFKNGDGYILGESTLYLDKINDNNKWKKVITYCEDYANEVTSYKVKDISVY